MRQTDGQPVVFVAQPEFAPARAGVVYARPDDLAYTGRTWREELVIYNQQQNPNVADIPLGRHIGGSMDADPIDRSPSTEANPLGLLPAWQLYKNKTYRLLADTFGPRNLYIFSAGWGLVRSDFMIPNYDITLSPNATGPDKYKRRRNSDRYDDFAMLPADPADPVVFLGSKAYVPLFCQLTAGCSAHRIIFHNSKIPPEAPNCEIRKYDIPKKPTGTTMQRRHWRTIALPSELLPTPTKRTKPLSEMAIPYPRIPYSRFRCAVYLLLTL